MKCQKNRACVKQPANVLPDYRKNVRDVKGSKNE
jgi:hypothetical protein